MTLRERFPLESYASASPLINQVRHQPRPPCLVRSPEPGAVVAVEVFIEEQQIAPVRIFLEDARTAVDRSAAIRSALKERDHAPGDLLRHGAGRHELAA